MMKHMIIGTAGHIDHGKTCLIRALTGIDTDRLAEEKRRGITIDLGFAHMTLNDDTLADIIDVPGHEKFIRNMLAGVGQLDLVLMVVAADEGVMPQTMEHLDILSLLGVSRGIIVITKCDLVDEEMLALAKQDIAEHFAGTFLEHAPAQVVSARTGQGIEELRLLLMDEAKRLLLRPCGSQFRLFIDRAFTMQGFGTVVTGTLASGKISLDDTVMVYPQEKTVRVRGLQSCGQDVEQGFPGQRVAVNLTGVKKEELSRGEVLATPGSLKKTDLLDVKLVGLKNMDCEITNNARLHLFLGTSTLLCRVRLLNTDSLHAGEQCYAQLRLEEPAAVENGDRFVVRFYSPLKTIGGGVVLDCCPLKRKRFDSTVLTRFQLYDTGSLQEQVLWELSYQPAFGKKIRTTEEIQSCFSQLDSSVFYSALHTLLEQGALVDVSEQILLPPETIAAVRQEICAALTEYHSRYPLRDGFPLPELKRQIFPMEEPGVADALLAFFAEKGEIIRSAQFAALPDFCPTETELYRKISTAAEKIYKESLYSPPDSDTVAALLPCTPGQAGETLRLMAGQNRLVWLNDQLFLNGEAYRKMLILLKKSVEQNGSITLAQFRDLLGTSRKYAAVILESLDEQGVTVKQGDARILTQSTEK